MLKVINHEGNRYLRNQEIGIVVNNMDDEGSAAAGINCRDAAYHIGLSIHDLFRGTGAKLTDDANIDYVPWDENLSDPKAKKLESIVTSASAGADAVQDILHNGKKALSIGGNHTRGFDVIGALRYCHEQGIEMGLIWVDAHADLNTPETTPSGNIHGMVAATLTGRGPKELLALLKEAPFLKPENIMYVGLNDVDDQEGAPSTERQYLEELKALGMTVCEMPDVKNKDDPEKMPQKVLDKVAAFSDRLREKGGKLWVELDADVFDVQDMKAAVMDNTLGGMRAKQGYELFELIGKKNDILGMGISELAPDKDPEKEGAKIMAHCVAKAFGIANPVYEELKKRHPDRVNIYTLDPTKEQYSVGFRRFYKEPGCEYVTSGNQDCYVVKDGAVIEIKRFGGPSEEPQDIAPGMRVKARGTGIRYLGYDVGTIERIILPNTERETDHVLVVRTNSGLVRNMKIGEVLILNGGDIDTIAQA